MNLKEIKIKNYRSIEEEIFVIEEVAGSHSYSLIGTNESGKTSFLNAVALIDEDGVVFPKDFYDDTQPIEVCLTYELNDSNKRSVIATLTQQGFGKEVTSHVAISKVEVCARFDPTVSTTKISYENIYFKKSIFSDLTFDGIKAIKKDTSLKENDFDLNEYFRLHHKQYFWKIAHYVTFWKSDPKHLITNEINLESFALDPENTSIPLYNCFNLAGIKDITKEVAKIKTDQASTNNLQEKLSDKVTDHIKKVWPNHPVKIKFQINNMLLSFLIEDEKVRYKSKTTLQRSDGFRQFISFLLTISAESSTNKLSRSLLLLDEPETHLHPKAQEYLKDELIKITKNKENNIVFFATHSNYMIDKDQMGRSYRVIKQGNIKTKIEKIKSASSSYAEVNYEVFDILSSDYHNELYGYLEDIDKTKLDAIPKTKTWINTKTGATGPVSICAYIRHSIHHPENTRNSKYTNDELEESVKIMRDIKYPPVAKKTAVKKAAKKKASQKP